jgi:hypothetical protein
VQRRFLEVTLIGRQNLPTGHRGAKHSNRPHVGEFTAQAVVVLGRGGQPHAVIGGMIAMIAQDQHDLFFHVDRETPEHRLGDGIQ